MKCKIIHLKIYCLFLFVTISALNTSAQKNNDSLKSIWENARNSDSIRFNAINTFYKNATLSQPDSVVLISGFHFEFAQKRNNKIEMIKALREKSYAFFVKDNIKTSEEFLIEAIKIQSTLNDKVALARLYSNLASINKSQSKFVETIKHYNYSLKIFKETKQEELEAAVLGNLGLAYFELQYNEIASDYFKKSLEKYEKLNLQDKIGYISLNIGAVDFETENYKESIQNAGKALKIFKENNNLISSADCEALMAKSYEKLNKIDSSLIYINKSLDISQKFGNNTRTIQYKTFIASLYIDSDINKATQTAEEALALLDSNIDVKTKASLYNILHLCYKKKNKIELSHDMYEKYIAYNDSNLKEQSNLELIKEVVNQEYKIKLSNTKLSFERSEKDLKSDQLFRLSLITLICLLFIFLIFLYFRKINISNQKRRDELLEEIKKLKEDSSFNLVIPSNDFQLIREKIESSISRKLNDTDWNVLNILLKEPNLSNKEIAEKAFLSVDGIGSSLRRMYIYFDIKESKYKKISLIMEAIKASNQ